MGQRLNIEIMRGDKVIANCYYHWSAYTVSALATAFMALKDYKELKEQNLEDEVLAVRMLEKCDSLNFFSGETNYAGLSEDSYNYMCEKYPDLTFNKAIDRNAGLIGVTEKDMENTRGWEEGRLIIFLDTEMVDNSGVLWGTDIEEYLEDYLDEEERENFKYDELEMLPYDNLENIPFDKLEELLEKLSKNNCNVYKTKDGKSVILFIE